MIEAEASRVRVLLVEDSAVFADALQQVLARPALVACEVTHAQTLRRAVEMLGQGEFDVMLLDLSLPDSRGMETVEAAHEASPGTPIVVLTANDDESLGSDAVRRGAQDFLIKGQADDRLITRAIRYAIERRRVLQERDRLIEQLQEALAKVKKLSGMLPICSHCKKIRDDKGYWSQIEQYIHDHSEAEFTHGLCPQCAAKLYPDVFNRDGTPR